MGISERKQREKAKRANDILNAAEKVFFSKGYAIATMDDVAKEAELSKGTLYLYYKTKEELYLAIGMKAEEILGKIILGALEGMENGLSGLLTIGRSYYKFYKDHPNYFEALHYRESKDLNQKFRDFYDNLRANDQNTSLSLLMKLIEKGQHDGSIRRDLDSKKMAFIMWGNSFGMVQVISFKTDQLCEVFEIDVDEMYEDYLGMLEKSLKP
ncbi:TetR/AcrR family transcriptional regulator [Flexithrix dorotheae]|uniref:TetR/AcrR family transcriptional regulator n=1 Tax=Flexithrix dorotheae TaxID=70993 RepID=UPI00037D8F42|nr:TetR/AcrR family transcriptional regulator [Flexithrix dorotheae]